jgi:hypothetical protein
MHYKDHYSRDDWRSREERGDERRENRIPLRYDDIGKFDDEWREDRYRKEEK